MKYLGLAAAALMMTIGASAATITVTCGSFSAPSTVASGNWDCGSFNSLTGGGTVTAANLTYLSDYSNGLAASVTEVTNFSFTGGTFTYAADVVTTTGGSSSTTYTSAQTAPFTPINLPVLAGYNDAVTSLAGTTDIHVGYSNSITSGSALATTGYAQLTLTYTPNVVPEPGSLMLLGSGLVAFAFAGRKLVRK